MQICPNGGIILKAIWKGIIMNEIILNYIVQAILGGASGYITNDYAINMLFKEYTPLKIGGVIKKTRTEFIENLSSMVENDIIGKEKLQSILHDENFKNEFDNLTADFYSHCLYEAAGTAAFADMDNFHESISDSNAYIKAIIEEHMPYLYEIMVENLHVDEFLSKGQLNKISGSLFDCLFKVLDSSHTIEIFLMSAYKDNSEVTPADILDKNVYNTLVSNLLKIIKNIFEETAIGKAGEILTLAGLSSSLNASRKVFISKKIGEVINFENGVPELLNESILSYINSERGASAVDSLMNSLFDFGKKYDKSVFQLLDESFEENLKLQLVSNIPSVTENIVRWLNENSRLIDTLIEESIDEVVKESDGLKAKLLATIKNSYFKDLSKKYSIAGKIAAYVEKAADPEKLSALISVRIINILNNLTIGEIIKEAERNNITPDNAGKFIVNYINKNSEAVISKASKYISGVEVRQIFPKEWLHGDINAANMLTSIISSDFLTDVTGRKSVKYAQRFLKMSIGQLITEENAKPVINAAGRLLKQLITSNEKLIRSMFENMLKSTAEKYSASTAYQNVSPFINNEIYNAYLSAAENIEHMNLSTAIDKLNSVDKLSKNSSDALRSYAIKNTDVMLSGSIKAVVSDNLNKLNDDELVDLANDFIGRQLKPIMYFGGVLGASAGLVLAAFQNKPLAPAQINIANMVVYALVGYITNVAAINMIFRPYKENRLLAKIPFFRNFALGYIVKNQKTFADSTAHFIDSSLLSRKSINELFEKHAGNIKSSFMARIAENDFGILTSLLEKNKGSVVKGIYLYLKNKITAGTKEIGEYICNFLDRVTLSSVINKNMLENISSFFSKKLREKSTNDAIFAAIHSEKALSNIFDGSGVKNASTNIATNFFLKSEALLSAENGLNVLILKHEDKYRQITDKTVDEFMNGKSESISLYTANKINSLISQEELRHKTIAKISGLADKFIDRNKTFGELFDGRFKLYADSKMPGVFDKLSSSVVRGISESKGRITLMVQSEIKKNLGFIEKGMYAMMGGDEIIDELLTKIIFVKLPAFVEDKKYELQKEAEKLIGEKLYTAKVEALYTGINKLQINELLDNYLTPENSSKIENRITMISKELFSKLGSQKLRNILSLVNLHEPKIILSTYSNELNAFSKELSSGLSDNRQQIITKITELSDCFIDDFMKSEFKDIFMEITYEDVNLAKNKTVAILDKNGLDKQIYSALDAIRSELNLTTGSLIDKEKFIRASENYLISLLEDTEFEVAVKTRIEAVISEASSANFNFIDTGTKTNIINIFADACINCLKRNLDKILKAVEFDEIAREEIEKMEPKKIHEMFNSFGEKYFRRLMLYGFGGFVFGINMYTGFALTTAKIVSELTGDKK